MELYQELTKDVRFAEGLKSCMNCGVCTAICPAAEFYDYDPRIIAGIVQSKDEKRIEELLKSETIWYCGECMSCKTALPARQYSGAHHHGIAFPLAGTGVFCRIGERPAATGH